MGLIEKMFSLLFGGGRNVVKDTVEVFRENSEAHGARMTQAQMQAMRQYGQEFVVPRQGGFDRFMDGVNRLPRPAWALGTLGLFVSAMVEPLWFAERMQGIALVPEPLWWLLGVIVSFYFGAMAAWFGGNLPPTLRARVLSVQAAIGVAFLAFILFTSNPFLRVAVPPFDGQDLNPLLQDPGLAFHPPFLYLGYVGLSMTFSFAVAALIEGRVDAAWGRWVRPWTLAAWIFLTIGIALGSWWAYYELGWGGFWFWDPVENASFMPWLLAAALLHSAIVIEKRESLKSWTILLATLAFGFSLIGTFIVRSGLLTSVHAFANDPAWRVHSDDPRLFHRWRFDPVFDPRRRDGG